MPTKLTKEEFVRRSKEIHGDLYDYSEVEYINNYTKVKIWSKEHQQFFYQEPRNVLSGIGSGISNIVTKDIFIERAKEVHGDKYSYDDVDYINSHTKVKIWCNKHKEHFLQSTTKHIEGRGCPKCWAENRLIYAKGRIKSQEEFIKECEATYGDRYDYSKAEYKGCSTKVTIICPTHGEFYITPNSFISGRSICNECSLELRGWSYTKWEELGFNSKHFNGFKLYIIECWNEEERFFKIGKTFHKVWRRFRKKKLLPYKHKVIKIIEGSAREISELETELLRKNYEFRYKPKLEFGGQTECFTQYLE